MIRAPFDNPALLAKLRPAFDAGRSVILPGACDPARRPQAALQDFDLAHRGRYAYADLDDAPLAATLRSFAEAITGMRLAAASLRLFRFRRGGYALFYDDALSRLTAGVVRTISPSLRSQSNSSSSPPSIGASI